MPQSRNNFCILKALTALGTVSALCHSICNTGCRDLRFRDNLVFTAYRLRFLVLFFRLYFDMMLCFFLCKPYIGNCCHFLRFNR